MALMQHAIMHTGHIGAAPPPNESLWIYARHDRLTDSRMDMRLMPYVFH